jgi:hypothetical protein
VWQGSTGLAADSRGNLYFTTGNRRLCGAKPAGETIANSVIRLKTERRQGQGSEPYHVQMEPGDHFTPYRRIMEDCFDLDLSAAGVLLIPGTHYLGTGGKEGVFYVLDRADMGGYGSLALARPKLLVRLAVNFENELNITLTPGSVTCRASNAQKRMGSAGLGYAKSGGTAGDGFAKSWRGLLGVRFAKWWGWWGRG